MRFLNASLMAALALLLSNVITAVAAGDTITGHLIFEDLHFSCESQCMVTLLASGVRPVQTVLADFSGRFVFGRVPPGPYTIRVEIDGFQAVNQSIDARDAAFDIGIYVPLVRKTAVRSANGNVVDVSEFLDRYPKKAVSAFEKGSDLLKKRKNDEAVKYFRDAVELAPGFYAAHNQLGIAYRETGRLDEAEQEFLKAHEINATNVEPLVNLTALYIDQHKTDQAVDAAEKAVKLDSHSTAALLSLGVALYKADQFERAEAALKRALDLNPKMGNVRLMLANVYLKMHRYNNTLEQLNSYIAENPKGQQLQAAIQMRDRLQQAKASQAP
jgi:tetratricopeptide (TPR) repeat protein